MRPTINIPSPIQNLNSSIFKPLTLEISDLQVDSESKEYFAHTFKLGIKKVVFRSAKTTPTKMGLFVSIWKRNDEGTTCPFNAVDSFDYFLITTQNQNQFGVFIFSKLDLLKHGILSNQNKIGKRGIRVYPPWDLTTNKQAQNTQAWQIQCFVNLSNEGKIDLMKAKSLLE